MRTAFVALVCLVHGALFAQSTPIQGQPRPNSAEQVRFEALMARIQDFQQRHSITIDGADNPAGLRRGALLGTYFARFRSVDDASFAQFALEEVGAAGSDLKVLKEARNPPATAPRGDACAMLLEGSLADADGLDIANHIVAVDDESDRAMAAPYERVIERLSPRVRANVLLEIDQLARSFSGTELDHLGMAREDPELYKTMTTGFCRGRRNATSTGRDTDSGTGNTPR